MSRSPILPRDDGFISDHAAKLFAKLRAMPAADKERMRRILSGEADADLIRRGDIVAAIRDLRVGKPSLASRDYQRALADVQRAVSDLDPPSPMGGEDSPKGETK